MLTTPIRLVLVGILILGAGMYGSFAWDHWSLGALQFAIWAGMALGNVVVAAVVLWLVTQD